MSSYRRVVWESPYLSRYVVYEVVFLVTINEPMAASWIRYLMVEHGSIGCSSLSRREEEWDRTQNSKNKLRSFVRPAGPVSTAMFRLLMSMAAEGQLAA